MRRWIKRGALAFVGTLALAAIAALVFVHTDAGREIIRGKLEAQLAKLFVGGARVGKLEGSPFGELVVRELVIAGPDGTPAITIATLRVHLRLRSLIHEDLQLDEVVAEDVAIDVKRDADGDLALAHLLRPNDDPKTTWTIDLASFAIRRARLAIDTGTADAGIVHLDDLAITGNLHVAPGGARAAGVQLAATWRERHAPLALAVTARDDGTTVVVPSLAAIVGGVTLGGTALQVTRRVGRAPLVGGRVALVATRAAVAALLPRRALPADLTLAVAAAPGTADAQPIALTGTFGPTAIDARFTADLDARHVIGTLATGDFDLAQLAASEVVARGGLTATFDATPGASGELPVATVHVVGHGVVADLPRVDVVVDATSRGQGATTTIAVTGPATARLEATLVRAGDTLALVRATLAASTPDPRAATGGRTPLRGALAVALTAHGPLFPEPALVVSGTIDGTRLRLQELALERLAIAFDAAHVPAQPDARARVRIDGLARGPTVIPHLDLRVGVASRADRTLAIEVRDPARAIAVAATIVRAGPHAGDLTAHASVVHLALAGGFVGARADVARTAGAWRGAVAVDGKGIAIAPLPALDVSATLDARPGTVTLAASASRGGLGTAALALEVAAPARLDDVAAWRARGRGSIRKARLQLTAIDLGAVATLAGQAASGMLDGTIELDATTVAADLDVHALRSPSLRGIRSIDAALAIRQPATDALTATVTVAVAEVGTIAAEAHLAIPSRVFDPRAWTVALLRDATIRTGTIAIDPALLDRLGITSPLHARASARIDLGEALRSIGVHAELADLRGTPFARPVNLVVDGAIDGAAATATLAMTEASTRHPLLTFAASVPGSLADLLASPTSWRARALTATVVLPHTSAPEILRVFGRDEITHGTLDGTVTLGGTLGKPTIAAHVVGKDLGVPPGPRGKPVAVIDAIVLDATGDLRGGHVTLVGTESNRGTLSIVADVHTASLADATARIKATTFDLSPLLAFAPGPAGGARGTLDADLTVTGFDLRTAKIVGEVHLRRARVPIAPAVGTLRDATIDIAIHPHDIAIRGAGKLGRGEVTLDGTVGLDGATLAGGRLKLGLRKVSPIGVVEPVVDADVAIELSRASDHWKAAVVVDHALVKVSSAKGEAIKPSANPSDLTIGRAARRPTAPHAAPTQPPALVADVTLRAARVVSEEFRTTIDGHLVISIGPGGVGIVGGVSAQSGDLDLFDRRYHVEQADVRFDGTIDPLVAIRITHDFSEVTTVTTISGRLAKPHLELTSDPGTYSQSELLGFLLGGEPGGDPNSASARDKLTGAGTSLIAGQIGGYVKRALPFDIDVIRYETATIGSSAALTVGTWLTHTLFFAYRQHLSARPDENSGEGIGEYWLTRRIEIEATAGDHSFDSIDILWRRRF